MSWGLLLKLILVARALVPAQDSATCVADGEPPGIHRGDAFAPGQVVLTFDDGPYREKTPVVLDLLAEHGYRAAFFVVGRHITRDNYPVLQRMEAEGHVIGSHSYDHDMEMSQRLNAGAVDYIRGQHEATRMLIEIALMATSAEDFDALCHRVLERPARSRIAPKVLAAAWPGMRSRHEVVLHERGFPHGRYRVTYSRPPGGGPYMGTSPVLRARYDEALEALGMLNVMWHGQSGDVHATRARESAFLRDNIVAGARRGGVLLVHDFIKPDALEKALTAIAGDPDIEVIGLDEAIVEKYGHEPPSKCSVQRSVASS